MKKAGKSKDEINLEVKNEQQAMAFNSGNLDILSGGM